MAVFGLRHQGLGGDMDSGSAFPRAGWWQASDGNWYPPESRSGYMPALPDPPTIDASMQLSQSEPNSGHSSPAGPDRILGLRKKHLLIIGVCVLYIVSPIDFAPELVLGPLGVGDDLIAVVSAIGLYAAGVRGKRHRD